MESPERIWLPGPPRGTPVCLGFDGSENNDWTALAAETMDGYSFTPRYGPDQRPTIWDPQEWGGSIPRDQVRAAVDEVVATFRVARAYCDPQDWRTEIGEWALEYGEHVFREWPTNKVSRMHPALRTFEVDLVQGRIEHDDCPITRTHVANARKVARPGQMYILGKPTDHQKIDAAMARVLAHEAKQDAMADGWKPPATRVPGRIR